MSSAAGSRLPRLLLVAGAGRSGTSLVTGLCSRLGFHIPLPEVTADASNPRGFGESRWVVDFHNDLLKQLNMAPEDGRPEAWDIARRASEQTAARATLTVWLAEELRGADRVVVKDPRLTWFVGLWDEVARGLGADVSVLTMLRHPAESITSRRLAYGTKSSPTTRTASWLNMTLGLEAEIRSMPHAVVAYGDLLTDWRSALAGAESSLGFDLVTGRPAEELEAAGTLVDSSLRRADGDWAALELAIPVQDLAERTQQALARGEQAELDLIRADYLALYTWAADLTRSRVRAARVEERRKVSGGRPTP